MGSYDVTFPDCWPEAIRAAMLHAFSLAHWAVTYSRSWCADSPIARVRLKGQLEQARDEIAMLKEEIRMKIIHPLTHPEIYKSYGKAIGGGILMYGPPGCGKTHLARATAGEVKAGFMAIAGQLLEEKLREE